MRIEIISSVKLGENRDFQGKILVVIDVLRATSVMVTAFMNGAKEIYPFKDLEEIVKFKEENLEVLLAGERKGLKIQGFNMGNSPLEFTKERVENKKIAMTTSNGTRAIEVGLSADHLYIGSYLNLMSVVEKLEKENKDIVILCSGTDNEFSLDDSLCAGIIVKELFKRNNSLIMDDFTMSLMRLGELSRDNSETLKGSKHFEYLKKIGYENDLNYCLTMDIAKIVPEYIDGKIKIRG